MLSAPQNPWDYTTAREIPTMPVEEIPWDEEWFQERKKNALEGLRRAELRAYMEIRFSLTYVTTSKTRFELLEAISRTYHQDWQFGIEAEGGESKPQPSDDGI